VRNGDSRTCEGAVEVQCGDFASVAVGIEAFVHQRFLDDLSDPWRLSEFALVSVTYCFTSELKIRVSVVRFRPWPPVDEKRPPLHGGLFPSIASRGEITTEGLVTVSRWREGQVLAPCAVAVRFRPWPPVLSGSIPDTQLTGREGQACIRGMLPDDRIDVRVARFP